MNQEATNKKAPIIDNVSRFIEQLTKLTKLASEDGYEYFYRGHSDKAYKLEPSIYRKETCPYETRCNHTPKGHCYDNTDIGLIFNEDKIFKEMITKAPNEFVNEKTALEKLVKMQHYGLPTRLLDLTANPLVALYFAAQERKKLNDKNDEYADGEVVIFKIPKKEIKFYDSDTVSILANISKRPHSTNDNYNANVISRVKIIFNKKREISYLLHEIQDEKPYFKKIIKPEDIKRVIAVKAKMNNQRILNQSGIFLIFGIGKNKTIPAEVNPEWISIKITIPNGSKKNILKELNILGFNESTLFPELEHQSAYIKKLYTPK